MDKELKQLRPLFPEDKVILQKSGIATVNAAIQTVEMIRQYKPDVIHYNYDAGRARFYDSTADKFFIFFPSDWHIAKIENDGYNQDIRVIVIKVDYID